MAPSHSAGASIWGITSTASQAKISMRAGSYHLLDPGSQPPCIQAQLQGDAWGVHSPLRPALFGIWLCSGGLPALPMLLSHLGTWLRSNLESLEMGPDLALKAEG